MTKPLTFFFISSFAAAAASFAAAAASFEAASDELEEKKRLSGLKGKTNLPRGAPISLYTYDLAEV